jgi:hypothetical protein
VYQLFLPFLPLEKRMKTLERKKRVGKKMEWGWGWACECECECERVLCWSE